MNSFFSISSSEEGFFKDKGSKFLSFSFPVDTELDIKRELDRLKNQYHDARHFCYAWVLGLEDQRWKCTDDGEPSHTAGDPILGQIRSLDLTNVLVVVVRYFGGTKLGRSGLINAYKQSAEQVLNKAAKTELFEVVEISLKFGYDDMSKVERLVEVLEMEVVGRRYTTHCEMDVKIKKEFLGHFQESLKDNFNVKIEFRK